MVSLEQLRISGQLPSPKGVALAIMEISRREDATADEVARVVQSDPALSSRLLRLANNAAAGGRPLVSIREAVMRLGMKTVHQLAMGFSLVDQFLEGPCAAFDYPGFWSHSLFMAVASQELPAGADRLPGAGDRLPCGIRGRTWRENDRCGAAGTGTQAADD